MKYLSGNNGVTMLEVLAVATIVGILALVMLHLFHFNLVLQRKLDEKTQSATNVLNQLNDLNVPQSLTTHCDVDEDCQGIPLFCLSTESNQQRSLLCTEHEQCEFIEGGWQRTNPGIDAVCDLGMVMHNEVQ